MPSFDEILLSNVSALIEKLISDILSHAVCFHILGLVPAYISAKEGTEKHAEKV